MPIWRRRRGRRGRAPPVQAHHHVGGGPQRPAGDPVATTGLLGDHHDVRVVAGGQEGVGAAVHADQHRAGLLDEAPDGLELLAVLVPGRDDHHRPVRERGAGPGDAPAVQEQVLLAAEELAGVVREARQVGRHALAGLRHLGGDLRGVEHRAGGDGDVVDVQHPLVQAHRDAVLDRRQHLGAGAVDEHDPGGHQYLGAEGGVAAGDHRRRVDHGGHAGVDELVGAGPVEVEVVEHGDVTGLQPGHEGVGTPLHAGGADQPGRRRLGGSGGPSRKLHDRPILSADGPPPGQDSPGGGVRLSGSSGRRRAAPARGPGRCRTPPPRRASATAPGPARRRRARSGPTW